MVTPIDLLERDERAAEARALLDNPLLQEIYSKLESDAFEALIHAEPGSPAATSCHLRIMALRAIQADLIRMVEDPKMLRAANERRRRLSQ
jgi:hypothetical protein